MATHAEGRAPRRTVRMEIPPRTVALVAAWVVGAWLLLKLWPVLMVVVVALLLVGTLHPVVVTLEKRGLRRPWAVALLFLAGLAVVALLSFITVPALLTQLGDLASKAPEYRDRMVQWMEGKRLLAPLAAQLQEAGGGTVTGQVAGHVAHLALTVSERALLLVGYSVTTLFLAIYLLLDIDRARGLLYAVLPRRYHLRTARILLNLETIVGGYVRGQVITSVAIALFTFGLLSLFRVPNALALATFAALTDVLPFIGGLLATTPVVLATLVRGVGAAVVMLVLMVLYQEFESRVLVPRVYGHTLRLPAAVVLVSLLIGGELMGILGALLALPVAAGIRMALRELRVELPGDAAAATGLRERDEKVERTYEELTAGAPAREASAVATELAENIRAQDAERPEHAAEVPITGGKPDAPRSGKE